jgi:hypothetical protein
MDPDIRCAICNEPVALERDLYADEDGQIVHESCYIARLTASQQDPPNPQHTE